MQWIKFAPVAEQSTRSSLISREENFWPEYNSGLPQQQVRVFSSPGVPELCQLVTFKRHDEESRETRNVWMKSLMNEDLVKDEIVVTWLRFHYFVMSRPIDM